MLVGLWLAFAPLPSDPGRPTLPRERALWDHRVQLGALCGRVLELVLLSNLLGEIIWFVVDDALEVVSWRTYTLWGSFHLTMLMVVFGRLADATGRTASTRLLSGAALGLFLLVAGSSPSLIGVDARESGVWSRYVGRDGDLGSRDADVKRAVSLTDDWFDQAFRRLEGMPAGEPVLFVAASGGGSRAAIWATWVLEALERTPLTGGLSTPPPAEVSKVSESLADRVLFISAVSGGSVGSANVVFREGGATPDLVNTLLGQLEEAYRATARSACRDHQGEDNVRCRPGAPQLFEPTAWPVNSTRADEVSSDFNAPALRGIVMPGVKRGASVGRFWEEHFQWNERFEARARAARSAGGGSRRATPLLLVNSTEVHTGYRLVAGFPPLPPGLLWSSGAPELQTRTHFQDERRFRGAVYWSEVDAEDSLSVRSVSDIDPFLKVPVHEAVRMSANFPWGFDLPRLNTDIETAGDRVAVESEILVVDGGVLDNTGIDTFAALIARLERLAAPPEGSAEEESSPYRSRLSGRAARLLDELSARGIILLEIDSGSKPDAPRAIDSAFASVLMPIHALSEAGYVREIEARERHVALMQRILGERAEAILARELPPPLDLESAGFVTGFLGRHGCAPNKGVSLLSSSTTASSSGEERVGMRLMHVTYTANREDNIMTGWALSPEQKGELLFRFLFEDDRQREEMLEDWLSLRGENLTLERLKKARWDLRYEAMLTLVSQLSEEEERQAADEYQDRRRELAERNPVRRKINILERAERKARLRADTGWIYLGYRGPLSIAANPKTDGAEAPPEPEDIWLTHRLEMDLKLTPSQQVGQRLPVAHHTMLHVRKPTPGGDLGPRVAELKKGTKVTVLQVHNWEGKDFWFAEVQTAE